MVKPKGKDSMPTKDDGMLTDNFESGSEDEHDIIFKKKLCTPYRIRIDYLRE